MNNTEQPEEYPLEVGGYCYILGHEDTTNKKRSHHGGAYQIVELPTGKRRTYKLTDIDRPGSYYLYYHRKDLISFDDPSAIQRIIETS